ncbi:MAG: recombinase family protein [Oscillospiraceae bacterium]|nr:recombinase family protein [Oscillospiraceae bacterium]
MARIRKTAQNGDAATGNTVWHIALYIRLSKDDGNDESLSVTNQKKILTEYVAHFFQGEYEITDYYVDDGRTGTDYDRPDFQRMIHDVEGKTVNCVICKNLARAFRNYADQGYFLETFFPLHSVRFITLGDPKIDTHLNPEAISGMEVPINGLMNDRFAYATSSSVRRTFDTKRRAGEFIGAFAPYGYAKHPDNKNALVIDEEAAQVVRDIFQWFVYGDGSSNEALSKEGIARKLNALAIPNPTRYKAQKGMKYQNPRAKENDGLWTGTSVARLLKNKVYVGTMVQGRQRVISYKVHDMVNTPEAEWYQVAHTHEPIISAELFALAQALHARDTRTAPQKQEKHLFSGFLFCADCGKAMTRRSSKGIVYYNCSTYKRKSKELCTRHTMRLDKMTHAVLLVIQTYIALEPSLADLIAHIHQAPSPQAKPTRLARLLHLREEELAKTNAMIAALYPDWKNGDITHTQYREMKEKFEQQAAGLCDAVRRIETELALTEQTHASGNPYLQAFLTHQNILELSQGLLAELVAGIYVHAHGEITIQFTFADPFSHTTEPRER